MRDFASVRAYKFWSHRLFCLTCGTLFGDQSNLTIYMLNLIEFVIVFGVFGCYEVDGLCDEGVFFVCSYEVKVCGSVFVVD